MGTLIKIAVVIAAAYEGYAIWHNKHKAVAHSFEVHGGEEFQPVSREALAALDPERRNFVILAEPLLELLGKRMPDDRGMRGLLDNAVQGAKRGASANP